MTLAVLINKSIFRAKLKLNLDTIASTNICLGRMNTMFKNLV